MFDLRQGSPLKDGLYRKRELLNKFAKCIGESWHHLVLSGLIFCSRKQVDENYFHIVFFSDISGTSRTGRRTRNRRKTATRAVSNKEVGDSKK